MFSLLFYQFGLSLGIGRVLSIIFNGMILYYFLKTQFAHYLKATLLSIFMMNVYINLGIVFYPVDAWILLLGIVLLTSGMMLILLLKKAPLIYLLTILYTGSLSVYIMIAEVQI
jgi:hypothetical protein